MSILSEVTVPYFDFNVNSVSTRALTKHADQTICISGQSGSDGFPGAHGFSGPPGRNGASGYSGTSDLNGGRGINGSKGSDGAPGRSGTDSQHALISLSGTVDTLNMDLKIFQTLNDFYTHSNNINWALVQPVRQMNYNFQLDKSTGIVLVQAVGGNGGNGGGGGHGGRGGDGGNGAHGYAGTDGFGNGGSGSNGGPGGNGGDGGDGANGGSGGNGGDAGAGGHVQIRSTDPRLFMLVELDVRAGKQGEGGRGGFGGHYGKGGAGGPGGLGGRGASGGSHGPSGSSGHRGRDGHWGINGAAGIDGAAGHNGRPANDGFIQYTVIDIDGNVLESGPDKYHASVIGYTITDANNDGIYEPDSEFFITNVKWINNGAMTLPSGSILSFPSTKYVHNDINDISVLTNANINEVLLDTHLFKCYLHATTTFPENQRYTKSVEITSQISLLNRVFSSSKLSTILTCQYPIQITSIQIPTYLGPSERAIVTINFANISTRSYGMCNDSAGSLEFILSTHSLIKILPMNEQCFYEIMSDGNAHYKIYGEILPKSTNRIHLEILLDPESASQFYESLFWHIDLLLRDVIIEKHQNAIRVVPAFIPNIHTDVLLVTNSHVGRTDFLAYQNLFRLFNYTSQTWPLERHGVLHHPEIKWLGTTNLVIFIYSSSQSTFSTIKSDLLLQHIKSSGKNGFICIGIGQREELDFALFDYNNLQYLNAKEQIKAETTNHQWFGFGFNPPSVTKLNLKGNKIRQEFENQNDHRFLYQFVYDDTIYADSSRFLKVVYGNKYVYKSTLDSHEGNRLIMINCNNPSLTNTNTQQEIDLNSLFGRLVCAILCYQGFEKSYAMIGENSELINYTFIKHIDKLNFHQLLVSLAMSIIEREYDRGSLGFFSTEQLMIEITNVIKQENRADLNHTVNMNSWSYLLIQALHEYIDSKFFNSFPWCGCTTKAKQRHKLQDFLNDIHSLIVTEIPKNKQMYVGVRKLRLQTLAILQFPASDKREECIRSFVEIQPWQIEQRIKEIPSPSSTNEKF